MFFKFSDCKFVSCTDCIQRAGVDFNSFDRRSHNDERQCRQSSTEGAAIRRIARLFAALSSRTLCTRA